MANHTADQDEDLEYPDDQVAICEALWGKDCISPGGIEETQRYFTGMDLKGKKVLEVGSGYGGPAFWLAKECGVEKMVGIDIQESLIKKTTKRAQEMGLTNIEFLAVQPVTWPFKDNEFDVVFSKDALCHTEDKFGVYSEMIRVLKPGGTVIYADWFGSHLELSDEFKKWQNDAEFKMVMQSLGATAQMFIHLGCTEVQLFDRCKAFQEIFEKDVKTLRVGELHKELAGKYGAERLEHLVKTWYEPCAIMAGQGQLRIGYLKAKLET